MGRPRSESSQPSLKYPSQMGATLRIKKMSMGSVIEFKEDVWRIAAVIPAAGLFFGAAALFGGGFWFVGAVGGGGCLFIAIYSLLVGRVKVRFTDTALDYRTFRVVIPYSAIYEVRQVIPISRQDPSVKDCVWIRIDPEITKGLGFIASRAIEKKPDGSVWLPVGLVGQSEDKPAIFNEISKRITSKPLPDKPNKPVWDAA
jgi:hypothetical protein